MGKKSRRVRNDQDLPSYLTELMKTLSKSEAIKQYTSKIADAFVAGPISIVDNGCDHTVFGKGWLIPESTKYKDSSCPGIAPAFGGDTVSMAIGTGYSTYTTLSGDPLGILRVNQGLVHPSPGNETMISEDQMAEMDVYMSRQSLGRRLFSQSWDNPVEVHHNGCTSFVPIRVPTNGEMRSLKHYELTPREKWNKTAALQRACEIHLHGWQGPATVRALHVPHNPESMAKAIEDWKTILCGANRETVIRTLAATTQTVPSLETENRRLPRQLFKNRHPWLRPRRLNEKVYTDTFEYKVKGVRRCVQLFFNASSRVVSIYLIPSQTKIHEAYSDFITDIGAPTKMIADNHQSENKCEKVKKILRSHQIARRFTETNNQQQNRAERFIGWLKERAEAMKGETSMDPSLTWYLLKYIVDMYNLTANNKLNWQTPLSALTGETQDISHLRYKFWEPIWIHQPDVKLGDEEKMVEGRCLGLALCTGHMFTYHVKIASDTLKKVVQRSVITARAPNEATFGSILSPADRTRSYLFPKSLTENDLESDDGEDEGGITCDEPLFP